MFINIRNVSVLGIVAGMLAILLSLGLGAEQQTEAAVTTFEVSLTGAAENPPVTSPGSAFARFTFDDVTRQLTYAVTVSGLSPNLVTAAHIHRGAVGVNGPIVHFLSATGFTQVSGSITLSEADVADLRAGNFYANVHSVDYPGGFARGQMYLTPLEAIRGSVEGAIRAFNNHNLPVFLSYFTDSGIAAAFEGSTRAELLALGDAFFEEGPPSPISYSGLTLLQSTANTAVTEMNLAFIKVVDRERDFWVLEGGVWKINDVEELPEVIPAGVTAVDMRLQEFAFVYDRSQVASGRFAFKVQNAGRQFHEIALVKIDRSEPLLQLLGESEEGPPEGVEFFGAGFYEPGDSGNFVLSEPLAAGRYALVCFIPDEADGIPHALKGMFSEFTVGGATTGGVVRPPSTGDGGLLPSESDSVLATIGLVVMIASLSLLMGQKLRSAA